MEKTKYNPKRRIRKCCFSEIKRIKYHLLFQAALLAAFLFSFEVLFLVALILSILFSFYLKKEGPRSVLDYGIQIISDTDTNIDIELLNFKLKNNVLKWERFFIVHPQFRIDLLMLMNSIKIYTVEEQVLIIEGYTIYIGKELLELHFISLINEIIAHSVFKGINKTIVRNIIKRYKIC